MVILSQLAYEQEAFISESPDAGEHVKAAHTPGRSPACARKTHTPGAPGKAQG